jgi:hypothetical protein
MSIINPSAIGEKFDAEFEKQVANCTSAAEISELMKNRSISMGLCRREWDETLVVPNDQPVPQKVGRVVILNNVKHSLTANSEAELLAQESAIYRAALEKPATTQTEQPRNERGQFTAVEPTITDDEKTALELRWQLGQISAADYIEQSGAMESYLASQGIDVNVLREVTSTQKAERYEKSWAEATEEFLASTPWWVGGHENTERVGEVLIKMGAEESPSSENLKRAAEYLRDNNMLVENPAVAARQQEAETEQRIGNSMSVEQIRDALGRSSGMFGR